MPARFDFKRPHRRGLHGEHVEHKLTSVLPPSVQNVKLSEARTVKRAFLTWKMITADAIFRCGWMVREKGFALAHNVTQNGMKGAKMKNNQEEMGQSEEILMK